MTMMMDSKGTGQNARARHRFASVCVVGLGYIGLPTAAMFASHGVQTWGHDVNEHAVKTINAGQIHIVEPGLEEVVARAVKDGMLQASTSPRQADAYLIAVPTPLDAAHQPDISHVEAAARNIAPLLQPGALIVLESTSPVGTTRHMAGLLAELRPDLRFPQEPNAQPDVNIAYCPERVLPGRVIEELINNDRVIGGMTPACAERAAALYRTFLEAECILTNAETAEMCKLAENAYRDVNIAYANELSLISERFGIDVWELISLANRHPRVNILQPGCGVGGHCIAVDPWFIVASAPEEARLIRTAREINDSKPHRVLAQVAEHVAQLGWKPARIAMLGLAFKPDIDDLRESPALEIAEALARREDCELLIVEPHIEALPESLRGQRLCSLPKAVQAADIILPLVRHSAFEELDKLLEERHVVVDPAGLLAAGRNG